MVKYLLVGTIKTESKDHQDILDILKFSEEPITITDEIEKKYKDFDILTVYKAEV